MCGIAGILKKSGRSSADDKVNRIGQMADAMVHRGPDDSGVFHSTCGHALLAHRRLSIIDLSSAGHQPMTTVDGRFTIVFNGEIYNHAALRDELRRDSGFTFHTHSDTEVLLALYSVQGNAMLSRLKGMFAFALWDTQKKTCLIARDPLGIKPLYYCQSEGDLFFASELRALLASEAIPRKLEPKALQLYLQTGSVPEPHCLVAGVQHLPAGTLLEWSPAGTRVESYWRPTYPWQTDSLTEDPISITRTALLESIERHFVSDVPVGLFLSGGIDSTAVLALAHALGKRDLQTCSIGVDHADFDESDLAARTAAHFHTQHTTLELNGDRAHELSLSFLQQMDQPSIDGLNTYTVSHLAHEQGLKVVLSGLGGDELFAGYPSFSRIPQLQRLHRLPGARQLLPPLLRRSGTSRYQRLAAYLKGPGQLEDAYQAIRGIFSPADAAEISHRLAGSAVSVDATLTELPPDPADAISYLEMTRYMRNQLLRDSDVYSMAFSLELRVPLVDRSLFETLSRIPPSFRLRRGKQLLIEAAPEIPDWIFSQPKRGFRFPFQTWMQGTWGDLLQQSDSLLDGMPYQDWYQRWSVAVLLHWMEKLSITGSAK